MAKKINVVAEQPVEEVMEMVVVEPTIYDKFEKYMSQVSSGYLTGLNYSDAMEILRYCESKMNINIPLNMSCGVCLMDLMKLFMRLKDK